MEYNFITNIESCYYGIPHLIYYSHIPTALLALLMGGFVFFKNRQSLAGKLLFLLTAVFSLWSFFNLILWVNPDSRILMLLWSFLGILDPLIFFLSFYFIYVFIHKKDIGFKFKLFLLAIIAPAIIFNLKNTTGVFDISNCEARQAGTFDYYIFGIELFFAFLTVIFSFLGYRKAAGDEKKKVVYASVGILLFFLSFFATGFMASYLDEKGYAYTFEVEQYGLFGMTIFIVFLGYLIVKFKAFDIKLLGAQALVAAIVILIASQYAFIKNPTNRILNGVTLFFSLVSGYFLVRSVKNEVRRKEELQYMSDRLAQANDQLRKLDNAKSEFISIASHQLRTPLTAIKGFLSLLLEGSYGNLKSAQAEVLDKVYISNERLVNLVEDLLNVSRIESGRMEFKLDKWKLEKICKEIVDMFALRAKNNSLYLKYKVPADPLPEVTIDGLKVREVISNLVDNAIKYTPKGGVSLRVELANSGEQQSESSKPVVRVTVSDTGIGIPPEELPYLFAKFSRGKDVSRLNTGGTGLGLYVGKSIVEANGGKIWAESEGEGKGSRFIIEFPVEQSKKILERWG